MISSPDFRSSSLSESSHNRPYDNATQDNHRQHETPSSLGLSWNSSSPLPPPSRPQAVGYHNYNTSFTMPPPQRPKLTTTVWEDEGTICYQVDAKSVCVARRQGNL
ncbi:hypothetical protein G6F58_013650 [Rhizopus delemar]|nr:hypothetical protein G6F58_013650 [Rhizopus delemar]